MPVSPEPPAPAGTAKKIPWGGRQPGPGKLRLPHSSRRSASCRLIPPRSK